MVCKLANTRNQVPILRIVIVSGRCSAGKAVAHLCAFRVLGRDEGIRHNWSLRSLFDSLMHLCRSARLDKGSDALVVKSMGAGMADGYHKDAYHNVSNQSAEDGGMAYRFSGPEFIGLKLAALPLTVGICKGPAGPTTGLPG